MSLLSPSARFSVGLGTLLLVASVGTIAYFLVTSQSSNLAATTDTTDFEVTVDPGSLSVEIVDGTHATVVSPKVIFSSTATDFSCQTTTGTFGTSGERLYVANPDAADNGWTLTMAATLGAATTWTDGGVNSFDFNDPTASGCTDGGDADGVGGELTVDPSVSTVANGLCAGCTTTGVSKGAAASFEEGVTDSITLITAAAGADDVADYDITNIDVSQTIPASQTSATYNIDFTITVTAS